MSAWVSLTVALLLGWSREARADCGAPNSSCLHADTLWVDPFPGPFVGLSTPTEPVAWAAGASLAYLNRPLLAVIASPDPFGNEVALLDDFWTMQAFIATNALDALDVAVVLPASIGDGAGAEALASRNARASIGGIGDPRLVARFGQRSGRSRLFVSNTLTLPLGQRQSYSVASGWVYAPKLGWSYAAPRLWVTAELGARLRSASSLGSVRFGSEASVAAGVGATLVPQLQLLLEWWALPALTRDEVQYPNARIESRRIPSELLLSLRTQIARAMIQAGAGTSLPISLSHHDPEGDVATFAGAPSAALRLQLQLEVAW